jgi:hypothetical protein
MASYLRLFAGFQAGRISIIAEIVRNSGGLI